VIRSYREILAMCVEVKTDPIYFGFSAKRRRITATEGCGYDGACNNVALMSRHEYRRLLKSREWKERSLKILRRRDWICEECGSRAETVHHVRYLPGVHPADHPDSHLRALCHWCHVDKHPAWGSEPVEELRYEKERTKWFKKMGWPVTNRRWDARR